MGGEAVDRACWCAGAADSEGRIDEGGSVTGQSGAIAQLVEDALAAARPPGSTRNPTLGVTRASQQMPLSNPSRRTFWRVERAGRWRRTTIGQVQSIGEHYGVQSNRACLQERQNSHAGRASVGSVHEYSTIGGVVGLDAQHRRPLPGRAHNVYL